MILSVHLMTYNSELYIEDTIRSILKQKTDFDFEIVVSDDCSTDSTFSIINNIAQDYPNLFKISKNDSQLGILRNFKKTLDNCIGKYVFDIAGDDLLKHDYSLQKIVDTLESDDTLGFIDCGYDKWLQSSNKTISFSNEKQLNDHYKNNVLLGHIYPIGHCYRKELLYKHVDFETYLKMNISIEDYPILVDMVMNTPYKLIKEALVIYRVHDTSFSNMKNMEHKLTNSRQMKALFDYFSDKYNFSESLSADYNTKYYKEQLFISGYFENKALGKESFTNLESKNFRDYIHYWASQYPFIRQLISLKKKLF